jgi:beta-lactam-binding protein with PASTA domain
VLKFAAFAHAATQVRMATRRDLPADVAAAFERVPEAGERFAALPAEEQVRWLHWIDRARGRRARNRRIDEMVRRLIPSATAAEEEVAAGPPPERYWWLWLLLLLLLVVGGLLAWYFLSRGDDKTTVPNVTGLRETVAVQRIEDEDLEALPRVSPSNRPQGVVFAQRPGAGTQLEEGQTVEIFISTGRLAVPDVTGLSLPQARERLEDAGYEVEVRRRASTRPRGVVVDQDPAAGVTAVRGATVTLFVSSGVRPVVLPSVVGMSQGEALQRLTRLGLRPELNNVPSDRPAGTVVAQNPPAESEVDRGSKVIINVSTGTPGTTTTETATMTTTTTAASGQVRAPRVVGLFQASALRRLNTLGLRPQVFYVTSSQPANRVVSQQPAAGTTLRRDAPVRINVSTGPNPQPAATVPNVLGMDQATAANTLRSAGFRVLVLNRPTSDQSQDGNVVDQQPRAGASIPGGSLVTIFIGRSQ